MVKRFRVLAGKGEVSASPMRDSTMLWIEADITELTQRLDRDGYLWIRHFLPEKDVFQVRV